VNSDVVTETSRTNLKDLAETLQKYKDTNILIEGHTDITGSREHNMGLSERRAKAVTNYLESLGVASKRVTAEGYGPDQPVGDNNSDYGRQQNRRVEVAIFANEKLKKKAEKGDLGEVSANDGSTDNKN
jgi:outer membrane protein OmpA-like peptidoglycan-associated protein